MRVKILQGPNRGRTFHCYGGKFWPRANGGAGRVSMDVLIQRSSTKGVGGYNADILIEHLEPRDDKAKDLFARLYAEQDAHRSNRT